MELLAALVDAVPPGWVAVATLLAGTAVLVAGVELLVRAIVRTAIRFRVSAFLLAILFSGVDFDNLSFGLFTTVREMENVAFGLAIGNPISVLGITLALGAILVPFDVEVPRAYLVLFAASPFALLPLLVAGSASTLAGVALLAAFVAAFGYVVRRELASDRVFMQSDEVLEVLAEHDAGDELVRAVETRDDDESATDALEGHDDVDPEVLAALDEFEDEGVVEEALEDAVEALPASVRALADRPWFWPAMLVVGVAAIVVGGEAAATGAEGVLRGWDLTGTFLGVTFVTLLYTIDDTMLVVEPLRLGYEDVAVGGVFGVFLFNLTATVGVIAVLRPLTFRPETAWFHFPTLLVFTAVAAVVLWRGEVRRRHGVLLLGLYLLYLAVNVRFLAQGLPVGG